ncbi:MAG: hypothetical protein QM778_33140 [Myxococcales bacterium]
MAHKEEFAGWERIVLVRKGLAQDAHEKGLLTTELAQEFVDAIALGSSDTTNPAKVLMVEQALDRIASRHGLARRAPTRLPKV